MRRHALALGLGLVTVLALGAGARTARAQAVPDEFVVETLVPGLNNPVGFDFLPGGRVLFVEQFTGLVRLMRPTNTVQVNPVLTVPGVSTNGGERGLLGVAVDPSFPSRPYVYLHYTSAVPSAHVKVARFTLSGDLDGTAGTDLTADPASRYDLIANAPDAAFNHNGGTVRFSVDGRLYASLGEDAVACAAQGTTSLRGVILRLRTETLPPGPGAAFRAQIAPPENPFAASPDSNSRLVGAYGLRNPFRFQVDPDWGTLVIGDVGANAREELNLLFLPIVGIGDIEGAARIAADAPLGANFGWPWFEGTAVGGGCGPTPPAGLYGPVYDYDRTGQGGGAAIISAGFYRRVVGGENTWPTDHHGNLFANDYYSGVLRRLVFSGGTWSLAPPIAGQPAGGWGTGFNQVSDWRIGPDGAMWYCRQGVNFAANTGSIGRIKGPGDVSVPPNFPRISLRLLRSPAVGAADLLVAASLDLRMRLRIRIVDLAGRPIRTLWDGAAPAVTPGLEFPIRWDGATDGGERAQPGMYMAFVESGGRRASLRIPFLR